MFVLAVAVAVGLSMSMKIDLRSINLYFSGFSNKIDGSMSTVYP